MRQQNHKVPKLPKALLDQLGDSGVSGRSRKAPGRKERRKAERDQRKVQKKQPRRVVPRHVKTQDDISDEEDSPVDDVLIAPVRKLAASGNGTSKPLKSILKPAKQEAKNVAANYNEPSPSPPPKVSRGVKDRIAVDDAEIAALEKKLGLKGKKKLPKSFEDDGLDLLLEGLDADSDLENGRLGKRKRPEDNAWLESKRRRASAKQAETTLDDGNNAGENDDSASDMLGDAEQESFSGSDDGVDLDNTFESDDGLQSQPSDEEDEDDYEGFGSEASDEREETKPRVRENPYIAPVAANTTPSAKYIPPSLRGPPSSDAEVLSRLRRQTQGLLNRLSEANLVTILKDIEQLYQSNARQYVTSTLIDLLLGLLCDRTGLSDTFLILHAGFIAAVYKVIGTDFGAQVIERLVEGFDLHYANANASSKETSNLMALLAELYNFQLVGKLSEINTELLLKIIRNSGSQLRQDDPSSLKDIVVLLQQSVAKVGEADLSVRTKFMIETINNLKNNRMKTGVAASAIVSEHTTRMKKTLGSLNTRTIKASEPLRIGLADIRDTEKKGKWWLVGASYNDPAKVTNLNGADSARESDRTNPDLEVIDSGTSDLLQLAREQRMNTDIRRAIFVTVVLLKLKLKRAQQLEIPRVLIHCAAAEQSYNPYYTLIARRLCSDHKLKKAFQFGLWDLFKHENDDDVEGVMGTRQLVNLARMFGTLIADGGLSITVLKTLNFAYLQPKTKTFMEVLFVTVILQTQKQSTGGRSERALLDVVMNVKDAPAMARGLQYFLKKVVSKADVAGSKAERETVRWGCRVATDDTPSPPSSSTPPTTMFKNLVPRATSRSFLRPLGQANNTFRVSPSSFYLVNRSQSRRGYATEAEEKDLVIIGGGVAGYVAAIKAGQEGLKVACIEKRGALGGTCLNVGCIPSKSLLNNSHLYHQVLHDTKNRGIDVGEVKLNLEQMMKAKDTSVAGLTKGVEFLFKKNNVEYIKGTGAFADEHTIAVNLVDGGETTVRGKNIIIATGSEATPFPGLTIDEKKVVTSTGAIALKTVPKKMVVIGGGIIGLEMASVWCRLGAEVTIVEFLGQIGGPGMDAEISKNIQKILTKQGLKFKLNTKVIKGDDDGENVRIHVEAAKGGKEETLDADVVLVAIGRRPYTAGLGLENIGLETDERGRIVIDQEYRTKLPHIRVIGDCTFGPMLAHKAEEEAVAAIEFITKNYGHVNYNAIPSVMYTHPEVAWVGQNEAELKAAGVKYKAGSFPFTANSRAKTNLDTDGMVKFLADAETDRILGIHIIGANAGEMIAEGVLALEYGASTEDVGRTSHAHPTLAEAFKEAAMATYGKAIHY
ncbi:hypothetical protein BJ546DRAFT_1023096 [Cryomyces antarcticus]